MMDYLHGDVVDGEFKAACQYEYGRESKILRKAAELFRRDRTAHAGEISFQIEDEFHCGSWFIQPEWSFIWECSSFPAKSWNQLTDTERADLLCALPLSTTKPRPLLLGEVMFLTHYLDQLKEKADKACAEWKEARAAGKTRQKVYPILELKNTPFVQVLLPLDFSKTRQGLLDEIDLWLRLPENETRFDTHKRTTQAGTEKQAKDRLKDLAAWKLFHELGWEGALDFAEQHRRRDKSGKPRAFHDPRQGRRERGKLTKVALNKAPLYSWQTGESAFRKAKTRVDRHLAELIPWEFGRFAEKNQKWLNEATERLRDALKETQASTKNS
jgi:hypothetical protein